MLLLFFVSTKADISGYEMQLVNIKTVSGAPTDNYKWRLKIYRPVASTPLPINIGFTIYANVTNAIVGNFIVSKTASQKVIKFPESDCYPKSANNAIEIIVYESLPINYDALSNSNNFYISTSSCCRHIGISNILGSSDNYGNTFTMDFPSLGSASVGRYNTSPEFRYYPSYHYKIGSTYVLDWSAMDVDGDSLNYSMVKPFGENTTKSFSTINYAQGFKSDSNIADGNPDFTINAISGQVVYKPTKLGFYAINVKVDEFRKISGVPTKIGTTYREFTFKVVDEINVAPVFTDSKNRTHIIRDTINFNEEYTLNLWGKDIAGDSLYMSVIPSFVPGENILDPNVYGAKFGYVGALQTGVAAQNLVLKGDSILDGQFKWKPFCKNSRSTPYKITFVLRDRNCSEAKDDTLHVFLYVKKKPNSPPMFISPDTSINNKVLKYYVKQNTLFQLNGDSIIRTYDKDSTQVVNIIIVPNSNNPSPDNFIFMPTPNIVNSSAFFSQNFICAKDSPYRYTFIAFDDDCIKKDTAYLFLEIHVLPEIVLKETICGVMVDSLSTLHGNIIYWERLNTTDASYLVYRKNKLTGEYDYIGNTTTNAFGDANVNTSLQNEMYKIVAVNTCGTKSDSSESIKSLLLNTTYLGVSGVQLNWDGYNGTSMDSFIVWRKYNNASFIRIATLSNSISTYTDFSFVLGNAVTYMVQLDRKLNCVVPSNTIFGNFPMISNQSKLFFSSINNVNPNLISIYPNPVTSKFIITGLPENEVNDIFIFDVLGKQVYSQKVHETAEIDLTGLSKGVYFVRIGETTRKLIKN